MQSTLGAAISNAFGGEAPPGPFQGERVTRAEFGVLDGRPRRVLLLCYATGWQVWDLESSGGSREPHELVSLRDGPITAALVLSPPDGSTTHTAATATAAGQYPLFAVCGPETDAKAPESDDGEDALRVSFLVRIYSMPLGRYTRTIPFHHPVLALRASRSGVLAVLTSQSVTCINVESADVIYSSRALPADVSSPTAHEPHIQPFGALALTSRWVAFASAEPAPPSMQQRLASVPNTGSAVAAAAHFAKLGGSALLKMGDAGLKAVQGFMSPQQSPRQGMPTGDPAPAAPDVGHAAATGTVLIRDLMARTTIAHFRAHGSQLCALAFSAPTPGACHNLVTASVHGTCVHVYAVGGGGVHHLYRLQRGWSPAIVQHVAFSRDANWLSVSTAKGTTHLFAINHGGGPVSADTHARCPAPCDVALVAGSPPAVGVPWGASGAASDPPVLPATETLHAVARVRATGDGWLGAVAHRVWQAGSLVGMPYEAGAMACALRTLADADTGGEAQRELLVVTPAGALTRYLLRARAADEPGAPLNTDTAVERSGPRPLGVTLVPLERWDVRRCPSWPERHGATMGGLSSGSSSRSGSIAALPPPPSYEEAVHAVAVPGSDAGSQGRPAACLPAVDDTTQVLLGAPSPASLAASPSTPITWPRPEATSTAVVAASVYGTDAMAIAAGSTETDLHESWGSDADAD